MYDLLTTRIKILILIVLNKNFNFFGHDNSFRADDNLRSKQENKQKILKNATRNITKALLICGFCLGVFFVGRPIC